MPKDTCAVGDCLDPVRARGWCSFHYQRWKKHGDALAGPRRRAPRGGEKPPCKAPGCGEHSRSLGYCKRHYQKLYVTGDALTPDKYTRRGAPLRERIESRVIKTPHCWFWTAYVNKDGYGIIGVTVDGKRKTRLAHRRLL